LFAATELAPALGDTATGRSRTLDFLIVDEFLRTLVDARALKTAFELGIIDRLAEQRTGSVEALGRIVRADRQGIRFLFDLLAANGVIEEHAGNVRFTRRFTHALRYRDLLEAKLDFAGFTINDFADLFTSLIRDPNSFMGRARLFELFDYRRAREWSLENYAATRRWMRFTSTLTRYEALACLELYDFGAHRRMLDVGGNSGEFLLQMCRRHEAMSGAVFDLPLVCEVGLEHVLSEPEASRMSFCSGDIRRDALPSGSDLITFKSMLHDWPAQDARQFIEKAAAALNPGGTLLIFERGPMQVRDQVPGFSSLPLLLFFRSYREPADYLMQFEGMGLTDIVHRDITLDSPFFLVAGRKPEAAPR
jgi:hypothetical protein